MQLFQNKKSLVKETIMGIIILAISFYVILVLIKNFSGTAEAKAADAICRTSVVLREKSYKEIYDPATGEFKITSVASPLLCRTLDFYWPEDKDATKEQIIKDFADKMVSCWKRYDEGKIKDVFKQGDQIKQNCQVCYTITLRDTPNFKSEIKSAEFSKYLFDKPYQVSSKSDNCKFTGGYCIYSDKVEDCSEVLPFEKTYITIDKKSDFCRSKGKKGCCFTDYGCMNKGGICSANNPDIDNYVEYENNGWDCPSTMKCFVKKESYVSFYEYVRNGPGNILVLTDIKPGETYAISFGSPTGECGFCTKLGLIGAGGGILLAGYFTGGTIFFVPAILGAGIGGYTILKGGSEMAIDLTDLFKRKVNTIYLTTLDQMQNEKYCKIVKDINEK